MDVIPFAVAAAALAQERLAYVWIYHRPDAFVALLRRLPTVVRPDPVVALSILFGCFKVLQAGIFGWWLWRSGARLPFASVGAPGIAGILLVVAGQFLNLTVFELLGRDGVFYGDRFGLTLPRHTEFPFSILAHPQYVGTCLSIWGLFLLTLYPEPGWYSLPLLESAYYGLGSLLEQ